MALELQAGLHKGDPGSGSRPPWRELAVCRDAWKSCSCPWLVLGVKPYQTRVMSPLRLRHSLIGVLALAASILVLFLTPLLHTSKL